MTILGVIGGMGPQAGLDFAGKIIANTQAKRDQDHLPCMLVSCPSIIPDRTEFLFQSKDEGNPAHGMFESAKRLHMAGISIAAVACNTAHAGRIFTPFCAMVKESLPGLRIINMLETCAAYVKEKMGIKRIGLLATKGTHKCRVYHEYFREEEGFHLLEPDEAGQENIHEAIFSLDFGIKVHSSSIKPEASRRIKDEAEKLIERGAEAVILGCTELPLAVNDISLTVPFIDPALITARRFIEIAEPEKLIIP